jgi:predicted MPP superfamily phosphohydrolase
MAIKKIIFFINGFVLIFLSCRTIKTVDYNLNSSLVVKGTSVKIVLISDLHSTIYGKDQSVLIEKIKAEYPDLILLTGDIIDDVVPLTGTELLLSGIKDTAPIYYVTGNHEYMRNDIQEIKDKIESYGVVILSDSFETVNIHDNDMIIAGIEDPYKQKKDTPQYNQNDAMEKAFAGLKDMRVYKILLAHRPENIKLYLKYSFDLIVSGHAHGGQVRLPFINGLYAPNQGIFPKYAGGLYRHGSAVQIVSRGLSVNWLPRVFNPPELVVIVIENPAHAD